MQRLIHELRSRELPLRFIHQQLITAATTTSVVLSSETEARYTRLMDKAEKTFHVTADRLKKVMDVVLLWQSFITRSEHLLEWIERITNSPMRKLAESQECDQESVVIKLMRFSELEKRAYEKQRVKDRVDREAKRLIGATGNTSLSWRLGSLNEKWLKLRDNLRMERLRLDGVCKMWREFQNIYQDLDHWINSSRIILQIDRNDFKSIDVIEEELIVYQVRFSIILID